MRRIINVKNMIIKCNTLTVKPKKILFEKKQQRTRLMTVEEKKLFDFSCKNG